MVEIVARVNGAVSIVNAIAIGKGSTLGIDTYVQTKMTVRDGTGIQITSENKKFLVTLIDSNRFIYKLLINKWYFDQLYEFILIRPIKKIGLTFWKFVDIKIIDQFGPDGFAKIIKYFSIIAVRFQNGFIYHYAFIMLIGFSILLTYLIIIR